MHARFNPARPEGGELTLDVVGPDGKLSRLRTIAPPAEVEVKTEPRYKDQGREVEFGPGYFWHPPELQHIDLIVRVRLEAGSTEDGVLYALYQPSAIMPELRLEHDSLKMLRETLASAQSALLAQLPVPMSESARGVRIALDSERIGRLIAEIDRQRPLGPDGKHGDLHTPTCGCER
jgi:hypothetical protein